MIKKKKTYDWHQAREIKLKVGGVDAKPQNFQNELSCSDCDLSGGSVSNGTDLEENGTTSVRVRDLLNKRMGHARKVFQTEIALARIVPPDELEVETESHTISSSSDEMDLADAMDLAPNVLRIDAHRCKLFGTSSWLTYHL